MNGLYFKHDALHQLDSSDSGFEWINDLASNECMLSFVRKSDNDKETLLVVANMAGVERNFEIGVPVDGRYTEIFNSDNVSYGGSGILNEGRMEAKRKQVDGRDYSVSIRLAPASISIFNYVPYTEQEKKIRAIKEEEEIKKEAERQERLKALQERRDEEQARLLEELRLKYERELAEQEKAIEEKYEKIEEERIFSIVTEEAVKSIAPAKKTTTRTASKKASTGKTTARKTAPKKKK